MKYRFLFLFIAVTFSLQFFAQVNSSNEQSLKRAEAIEENAKHNSELGNYAEAVKLENEVLTIREKVFGKEHPDYATSLNNLAVFNSKLGNYAEAIKLATEALNIREKVLGKEHPDYATSLNSLASYNL